LDSKAGSGSYGSSVSYSLQERTVIRPQELLQLEVGHFLGNTVETGKASFSARFKPASYSKESVPVITTWVNVELNYQRVILEAQAIVRGKIVPSTRPSV
jgi:hypothetical protein